MKLKYFLKKILVFSDKFYSGQILAEYGEIKYLFQIVT